MFPDLDKDIIDDVVLEKEGRYVSVRLTQYRHTNFRRLTRVGLAVDACLALSAES